LPPFELRPIVPAPDVYGYRNKMEFTVAPSPAGPLLGLHEADRYDVVLDIDRCLLQSDMMNRLLDRTRNELRARDVSAYEAIGEGEGHGLLRFVSLREGRRTGQAMVNLVASAPDIERLTPVAEGVRASVPET